MALITVDPDRCTGCGLCVASCDPACLAMAEGQPQAVAEAACITCGHCVAVCPTDALTHRDLPPESFAPAQAGVVPSPESLRQFFRQRRSVRRYQAQAVPRPLVEELLQSGCYAPTASNAQNVQFRALDDPAAIRELAALTVGFFGGILALLRSPVVRAALTPVVGREMVTTGLHDFARLQRELAGGGDPIFHGAPVVVLAHAPKGDTFGRDNCLYAVSTVMLEATARGLGTCLIGYFIAAWGFRPALRRALGLPRGQRAYAAFTLGVPAVRYRLAPPRRPIPVAWGR